MDQTTEIYMQKISVLNSPKFEDFYSHSESILLKTLFNHFFQCNLLKKKYSSLEELCRNKCYLLLLDPQTDYCFFKWKYVHVSLSHPGDRSSRSSIPQNIPWKKC